MSPKVFEEVFQKISLSGETLSNFKDTTVEALVIHKKEKRIELSLLAENILNHTAMSQFKGELLQQLPGVREVLVYPKYIIKSRTTKEIIEAYWDNIVSIISEESPICRGIIKDAQWQLNDSKLVIRVKNNTAFYLSKKDLAVKIQADIAQKLNIPLIVQFKDTALTDDEKQAIQQRQENKVNAAIMEITSQQMQTQQAKEALAVDAASTGLQSGILVGKNFQGTVTQIIDSKEEGEKVIVQGRVFNVEAREIKGDKYVVAFDITDFSDSTTVKFFIKKSVFEQEIQKILKTDTYLRVQGDVQFDKYSKEINIMAKNILLAQKPPIRMDNSDEKRVELHLHTQMSRMDGITNVKSYIKRAAAWGHKAIAITDHGVVQAFPDAMEAAKGTDLKVIYGVEAYLVDDLSSIVLLPREQTLDDTFVVFDIETTGLSKENDCITEIGAVKIENGKITNSFSTFVNPGVSIPPEITKLTRITDDMVKDAPTIKEVLPEFLEFCGENVLVAHNASFDVGFINHYSQKYLNKPLNNTVLDTLGLAQCLLPDLKRHKLNFVAEELEVSLVGHHRAVNDAQATAEILQKFIAMLIQKEVYTLDGINAFGSKTINYGKLKHYHAIILVKNQTGLRNLYELISMSHLEYFNRRPRIPKSKYIKLREGLIIGSACEAGELYRALLDNKPDEYIEGLVNFYDYLEIQPLGNNEFMINSPKIGAVKSFDDIKDFNCKIVALGEKYNKLVVATCDAHFLDPADSVFRKMIMAAEGFSDAENQPPLYYRTTEEMLKEFSYLGDKKAIEVVIENTNKIADTIDKIKPIPDETFPPKIDGAEDELTRITMEKTISIYGDPLPDIVQKRLDKELTSIIKNGFSVLYIIAQKLVWKSVEDGYLVGSRGSVGSSFVANMAGITEVNSLPPHYVCDNCKYSDFNSETVRNAAMEEASGCDMPDMNCPLCGTLLRKDGHDIPFETFLGFDGDKEPDIDLNFSGEYQQTAHAYTEELFGKGHVFKAGTIGTLADKTAYGLIKKYFDVRQMTVHNAEINRLIEGCVGVKRTTGQHPGGLMVVPSDHNIFEFCPIQRPANDVNSTIITTHFDYHSISGRLLKLDLLGHDDPTVIRMLYDLTGVNPQTVSLGDKETMSLFESPKALGVTPSRINCETGTLGIPEFGTKFVRQMLLETKPKTFADLLRISGLSHGTDVWINNAQSLIQSKTITLKETISTRDSIMIYLINKGVESKKAFKIMEKVRKGKGLTPEDIEDMEKNNVPSWYIESCQKIKYMFPKAHAAAYVMMAFRIAYFKINYPAAYYAAYFTVRASDDFDYALMCRGEETAKNAIREIHAKGNEATTKDKNLLTVLEIAVEFYARGFKFLPIDLYKSQARHFLLTPEGLIPPFNSLQGLGLTAAQSIVEAREDGEFKTIEEFKQRTTVGKTMIELLKENQILKGIPETNQLTLFM